jgi:hypothetical protein
MGMSIDQLNAELTRLHGEQKRILAEKKEVAAALDLLLSEKTVLDKLAAMSDAERQLLAQMIKAEGISPSGAVGVPGAG